jgi:hypothetical protein
MHDQFEAGDPILLALADFREEFERLVAEQRVLVNDLGREASGLDRPGATAVSTERRIERSGAGVAPEPRDLGWSWGNSTDRVVDREPCAAPPTPSRSAPGQSESTSADPRQRLDALARHLDRKVRRASSSGAARPQRLAEIDEARRARESGQVPESSPRQGDPRP